MSVLDYSKFEELAKEVAAEEREEQQGKASPRRAAKYVDSDGDTVSAPSDASDDEGDGQPRTTRRKQKKEQSPSTGSAAQAAPATQGQAASAPSPSQSQEASSQGGQGAVDAAAPPAAPAAPAAPSAPTLGAGAESESESESDDDEVLHPLFWTSKPKAGSKEDEKYTQVLKDLVFKDDDDKDKSPNQLAEEFKDKGNEFYKWGKKYHKRALKEYKEALVWARKGDGSEAGRATYAAILSNRAAIQLARRNFGSVVKDCAAAIEFGPSPLPHCRAHYRAACACEALGRLKEAKVFVDGGLAIDAANKPLVALREVVAKRLAALKRARLELERATLEERKLDEQMRKACVAHGITLGPLVNDIGHFLQSYVGSMTKGGFPRPTYEDGFMQWPVMFMYPESMQTEFAQAFDLRQTFRQGIEQMFPPSQAAAAAQPERVAPWDERADYTMDAVEVYFEERYVDAFNMEKMLAAQYSLKPKKDDYTKKRRVRVKLDHTLGQALQDAAYVVPGLPTFYVVSTRAPFYAETFCPQHEGRLRLL